MRCAKVSDRDHSALRQLTTVAAKKKSAASVKPSETREQKFVRLAVKRVNKAINDLRLVGNLGAYPHTDAQTDSIFATLQEAIEVAHITFVPRTSKTADKFTL